jgi:hypothetical protein
VPEIFLLNFSMKVLERLPLCEIIIPEKSYLNILNGNQDMDDFRFMVFLTLHGYLLMMQILQCIALCRRNLNLFLRLSPIVYGQKLLIVFTFNSAQQHCNDLTWKIQVFFRLLTIPTSVEYVYDRDVLFVLLTAEIHANRYEYNYFYSAQTRNSLKYYRMLQSCAVLRYRKSTKRLE